jgi:acetyl esterase/lipase
MPFARPRVEPKTIVYRKIDGADLSLDFYPAKNAEDAPLVVMIHGGSWSSGGNKDFVPMDQYLAGRGYAVADVLYRLAPRAPFPAASDDVRAAIFFLRERALELHFDATRIVLLGRSAGGQIALHAAYASNEPSIRGIIAFYAPTDLFYGWDHPSNPRVIDTKQKLTDYLGGSPLDVAARYSAASPARQVTAASPPVLLFHGGRDELVGSYHSLVMAHRLNELGVRNLNVVLPWATHGFDYFLNGPGGQISRYAIDVFLDSVCDRNSP